jgi:hypothetical protein
MHETRNDGAKMWVAYGYIPKNKWELSALRENAWRAKEAVSVCWFWGGALCAFVMVEHFARPSLPGVEISVACIFFPLWLGLLLWRKKRSWTAEIELDAFWEAEGIDPAMYWNVRSRKKPPETAEYVFYLFMTPQNCDALVGDLEERYKLIYKKFGRRRANFWYWTQTVISVGPIVWAWAKKVSLKPVIGLVTWAVARGLLGHDSWLAALVDLWKKVRS